MIPYFIRLKIFTLHHSIRIQNTSQIRYYNAPLYIFLKMVAPSGFVKDNLCYYNQNVVFQFQFNVFHLGFKKGGKFTRLLHVTFFFCIHKTADFSRHERLHLQYLNRANFKYLRSNRIHKRRYLTLLTNLTKIYKLEYLRKLCLNQGSFRDFNVNVLHLLNASIITFLFCCKKRDIVIVKFQNGIVQFVIKNQ